MKIFTTTHYFLREGWILHSYQLLPTPRVCGHTEEMGWSSADLKTFTSECQNLASVSVPSAELSSCLLQYYPLGKKARSAISKQLRLGNDSIAVTVGSQSHWIQKRYQSPSDTVNICENNSGNRNTQDKQQLSIPSGNTNIIHIHIYTKKNLKNESYHLCAYDHRSRN